MKVSEEEVVAFRAEFEAATTERARANVAARAYLAVKRAAPLNALHNDLRRATAEMIGATQYQVATYRSLIAAGEMAELLWPEIDGELPPQTALLLLREARNSRAKGETGAQAVQRVMRAYQSLACERRLSNGKVRRHASFWTRSQGGEHPVVPSISTQAAAPAPAPPAPAPARGAEPDEEEAPPSSDRGSLGGTEFWARLRRDLTEYLLATGSELTDEAREEQIAWLEGEVRVLATQLSNRLRTSRAPGLRQTMQRLSIRGACKVLLIDPPRKVDSIPPSFFRLAKKNFKKLAREYHPDTSPATRTQFEAVMSAWQVLEGLQPQ